MNYLMPLLKPKPLYWLLSGLKKSKLENWKTALPWRLQRLLKNIAKTGLAITRTAYVRVKGRQKAWYSSLISSEILAAFWCPKNQPQGSHLNYRKKCKPWNQKWETFWIGDESVTFSISTYFFPLHIIPISIIAFCKPHSPYFFLLFASCEHLWCSSFLLYKHKNRYAVFYCVVTSQTSWLETHKSESCND